MNIIERTQYSADGGETWHSTEAEARKETAEAKAYGALAEHFMDNVCGCLIFAIRENPDALITALRDMGALPEESGESNDWANGSWARAAEAVEHGELHHAGQRYAVIPAEQHAKEEAALARIRGWAAQGRDTTRHDARVWCYDHNITWEKN